MLAHLGSQPAGCALLAQQLGTDFLSDVNHTCYNMVETKKGGACSVLVLEIGFTAKQTVEYQQAQAAHAPKGDVDLLCRLLSYSECFGGDSISRAQGRLSPISKQRPLSSLQVYNLHANIRLFSEWQAETEENYDKRENLRGQTHVSAIRAAYANL